MDAATPNAGWGPANDMSPSDRIWADLGGAQSSAPVRHSPGPELVSELPVMRLARSSVEVCARAAAEFAADDPAEAVALVDDGAVTTAFHSERLLRVEGRAPRAFAPLSRFWRTEDGWVRTHANYPHHRARLLTALGEPADLEDAVAVERLRASLRHRRAEEIEEAVFAADGLAVAVREACGWSRHPQGAALASLPLVTFERLGQAPALDMPHAGSPRVLDLTRVIAGPVATRTLALLGADVLRLDAPWLPDSPDLHTDTGFGKRSVWIDLAAPEGAARFHELLDQAHVVVTGYRPGALDQLGLSPAELAARRPGLVIAELSAWGAVGPWAARRGFDSLVQAACGIALAEADSTGRPGALPVQALDHGTGYLLAAGVLRALTDQRAGARGSPVVRVSLAGTARWLLGQASAQGRRPAEREAGERERGQHGPWLRERDSPMGRLCYARSPVSYVGGPLDWSRGPGPQGADQPRWRVS